MEQLCIPAEFVHWYDWAALILLWVLGCWKGWELTTTGSLWLMTKLDDWIIKQSRQKCQWCGAKGEIIGDAKSFPGTKVAKCTKCHHEWETRGW